MRVLYVGNAQGFSNGNKYYLIPQRLINGFTRLGHVVYVFNDRDVARYSNIFRSQKFGVQDMNAKLIALCKDYRPDLIVLGHCKNVKNETLHDIYAALPGVKIIYRNVDPLSCPNNVKDIHQRIGHVDAAFITTAGEALKQFHGSRTGVYFMPNPADPALDIQKSFANENADIDVLFLASYLRDQEDHRHKTAKYLLSYTGELNVHIGGAGINENRIFGADYMDILGRSKMGVCINKTSRYYLYASDRMSQYMAAGILAFAPKGPNFEDVFGTDSFVSYETDEELLEKLRYYAQNHNERVKIAKAGYNKVRDFFHVDKICSYMIERVYDRPLSQDYQWPLVRY